MNDEELKGHRAYLRGVRWVDALKSPGGDFVPSDSEQAYHIRFGLHLGRGSLAVMTGDAFVAIKYLPPDVELHVYNYITMTTSSSMCPNLIKPFLEPLRPPFCDTKPAALLSAIDVNALVNLGYIIGKEDENR